MDLKKIQNAVEDVQGVKRGSLYGPNRKQLHSDGRKLFAIIAQRNDITLKQIADFTQSKGGQVREWIKRGDELYLYDKAFCEKYREIVKIVVVPIKIEKNAEAVAEFNQIIERLLTLDPATKAIVVNHIKGM